MRQTLAIAAVVALSACTAPTQLDPTIYGSVRVWYDPNDWPSDDRDVFRQSLPVLSRLGPGFSEATSAATADVTIAHWESPNCNTAWGHYVAGANTVQVDPVCAQGFLALQFIEEHEVMHFLTSTRWRWIGHICVQPGETNDCWMGGYGPAVLNPHGPDQSFDDVTLDEAYTTSVPQTDPTDLDLALVRHLSGH